MSLTIPDTISTPLVSCITTCVYTILALFALDRVSDFIAVVAVASNYVSPYNIPQLVLFAATAMLLIKSVDFFVSAIILKDYFERYSLLKRIASITVAKTNDGTQLNKTHFIGSADSIMPGIFRLFSSLPQQENDTKQGTDTKQETEPKQGTGSPTPPASEPTNGPTEEQRDVKQQDERINQQEEEIKQNQEDPGADLAAKKA